MKEDFIYAVARVRCKELNLLSMQDIDQLMASPDYNGCLKLLFDKGWGDGTQPTAEELISFENEKTWAFIRELTDDLSSFEVLLLPIDYNNLKAAIKSAATSTEPHNAFLSGGTVEPSVMKKAIDEKEYSLLPEHMAEAAESAYQTILQTNDGQLCDAILDRACLFGILDCGRNSGNEVLKAYAELTVAIANIKIAVRSCKTKKTVVFIRSAMVPCETLDAGELILAASQSLEDVYAYLASTPYAEATEKLKESYSAFEKWCDDRIMSLIKEQKTNPFTIGPLLAYVIARQNEMNTVRIILSGKLNEISDDVIRERLRDMYV